MTIEQALKAANEFCTMSRDEMESDWHLLRDGLFDQIMRTNGLPWQVYHRVIIALDKTMGWFDGHPVTNETETIEARNDYLKGAANQ